MPPLAPVDHVLAIKLKWTVGLDTTCFNTFHFRYTGTGPDNNGAASIANAAAAAVAASFTLSQTSDVVLTQTTVADLTSQTAGFGVSNQQHTGTAGGEFLPANTAVLVEFPINRRYRGGKPRNFIPMGQVSDLLNAQTWTAAAVTNFKNRIDVFVNQTAATTFPGGSLTSLVCVHYYSGGTWKPAEPPVGRTKRVPTPLDPPLVDVCGPGVVSPTLGNMRRRVRGKR